MPFSQIRFNATISMALFGAAALLFALIAGGTPDRIMVRLIIELPLLLLLTALGTIVIHLVANAGSTILGGSGMIAAALAFMIGWAVSGGGSNSFGGLGHHSLLQPAYALAVAAPWVLSFIRQPV